MLRHLYGPDTYQRQRYLQEQLLAPYYKKYPDGSVGLFDFAEEDGLAQLKQSAGAGLFAKTLLGVVYNPAEGEKEGAAFLKSLAENPHFSAVVISDKKLTKEFAFLYDGKEHEFALLSGASFEKAVALEAKRLGYGVSSAQIGEVARLYDGDTWAALTELARIDAGGTIAAPGVHYDFVGSMAALAAPELPRRLRALCLLLENDDPAKVFNMAGGWARGGGKVRIADYDIAVKSGKLEFADALFDYVLSS